MTVYTMQQTPLVQGDVRAALHDPGVRLFGALSIVALLVSMPATYVIMAMYHPSNDYVSIAQQWGSLVVFEIGALSAKTATLLFPQWRGRLNALQIVLLLFVFAANCIAVQATNPGDVGGYAFAAMMPVFQWIFLWFAVARAKDLQMQRLAREVQEREALQDREPTPAERIAQALQAAQQRYVETMLDGMHVYLQRTVGAESDPPALLPRVQAAPTEVQVQAAADEDAYLDAALHTPVQDAALHVQPAPPPAPLHACPRCSRPVNPASWYRVKKRGHCGECKDAA